MRPRRGITLIELTLSLGAGGIVMLLAITLVNQSMQFSKTIRQRSDTAQSISRLARQFRTDIHSATRAEQAADGLSIMHPNNIQIQYRVHEHTVTRELTEPSKPTIRDGYKLDDAMSTTFAIQGVSNDGYAPGSRNTTAASMQITSATGIVEPPQRQEIEVTAIVGRWIDGDSKSGGGNR
jgi:type II secretory pathway pseudopilin PulG